MFQWLRAGWTGINFAKPAHVLDGMKRFVTNTKTVLEFPQLPSPGRMVAVRQWLVNMPVTDLNKRYAALQQALRASAYQLGKISKSKSEEPVAYGNIQKDQMIEELMLEYLKSAMGKPTLLGKEFCPPSSVTATNP